MAIGSLKYRHCEYPLPVRHRPKVPFHPRPELPADFIERSAKIHGLDRELDRFILSEADYVELLADAFSSNIHYSSRLEGNPLSLEEVRRLTLDSFQGATLRRPTGPRQEIINHLLMWAAPGALKRPWSAPMIARVHAYLLRDVEDFAKPGEFRTEDTVVSGPKGVSHFITAPHDRIAKELDSLLGWLNGTGAGMRPEVAATLFFHEFESIHPFLDGNGRTGRTLFHAYLQTHGLKNSGLCMVEARLLAEPELYYRILGWTDYTAGYLELLDFFTEALLGSYEEAVAKFGARDLLSGEMDETAKRVIVRAKGHREWFSVNEAAKWVGGRGEQTVRKYLNMLVAKGALETEGRTRGKRFRFADPVAKFMSDARSKQVALDAAGSAAVAPRPAERRATRTSKR
jgi:Fic family protein